jgi:two-component system cell cycle sensor histidine kinase/response regulator CckA
MMSGHHDPLPIVLIIEDDDSVRTLLQALLGHLGFATVPAAGGAEGVAEYRRDPGRFAFVISDVHMPGLDGPAALDEMRRVNPDVRCFFFSGNPGDYLVDDLYARGAAGFLEKPITLKSLSRLLHGLPSVAL